MRLCGLGLHPPGRVTVISNGVHPSCSPVSNPVADSQLCRLLPIDSQDGIWLLNVGSSMPRKRLDLLLRVFAEVRKHWANVRLLRIGEGSPLNNGSWRGNWEWNPPSLN